MNEINQIGAIGGIGYVPQAPKIEPAAPQGAPSFKDTLQNFMTDVNSMQAKADESVQRLVAGEITDVHQVMGAVEEAKVAFNMMMEVRNKVMDAYQELIRMRL